MPRTYQVADVAKLTGLSVRALHHYHAIGLLVPTGRTDAGYRLYTDADLLRLQQISIGRELGFPLDAIRESLDDPHFDYRAALLDQRRRLQSKAASVEAMLRAVDAALAAVGGGPIGDTMDAKTLFGGFDPTEHEAEAKARWGDTVEYKEASARWKRYTPDDWKRPQEEQKAIYADAAVAMHQGIDPSSTAAADIAERHRLSIDRWFYPCSRTMHAGLADLYEADDRFRASIDAAAPGLTTFLAATIRANAARV